MVSPATAGRQAERARQRQLLVGEYGNGKWQPRGHLGLVGVALCRQPEHVFCAGSFQIREQSRTRRFAACSRALPESCPSRRPARSAGLAGSWIGEYHGTPGHCRQRHQGIVGRTRLIGGIACRQDAPPRHRRSAPEFCSVDFKQVFFWSLLLPQHPDSLVKRRPCAVSNMKPLIPSSETRARARSSG